MYTPPFLWLLTYNLVYLCCDMGQFIFYCWAASCFVMFYKLCVHLLFVDGHLGRFRFGALRKNAAVNCFVCGFWCTYECISVWYTRKTGSLGHGARMSNFSKFLQRVFLSGSATLYSSHHFVSVSVSVHTCQHLRLSDSFKF